MRNYIFIVCIGIVTATSPANSTPVFELEPRIDSQVFINDLIPVESISFTNLPRLKTNLEIDTINDGSNVSTRSLSLTHETSALTYTPKRWWHWLDGWNEWVDKTPTTAVPEPATMLLFGTGIIGVAMVTRKKMRK